MRRYEDKENEGVVSGDGGDCLWEKEKILRLNRITFVSKWFQTRFRFEKSRVCVSCYVNFFFLRISNEWEIEIEN